MFQQRRTRTNNNIFAVIGTYVVKMYGIINKVYSEEITNIKFQNCKEIDEPHAQLNNFEKEQKLLHFNLNRYVNQ